MYMCRVNPEKLGSVGTPKNAEIVSFQPEKAVVRYLSSNKLDLVAYDRVTMIERVDATVKEESGDETLHQ